MSFSRRGWLAPLDAVAFALCHYLQIDTLLSVPAGDGKRGKRKKVPAAAHTSSLGLAAAAVGAEAQQQDQGQDVDVLDVGAREESSESWVALLSGLAEICYGIGMALTHELCESPSCTEWSIRPVAYHPFNRQHSRHCWGITASNVFLLWYM